MKGNQMKMRKALLAVKEVADRDMRHHVSMSESDQTSIRAWSNLFVSLVDSALADPPRNCDVGTAEEQDERFKNFCLSYYEPCNVDGECWKCPLFKTKTRCPIAWAQMPYDAEKGVAK